jgi:RecB family endonuclease NucS
VRRVELLMGQEFLTLFERTVRSRAMRLLVARCEILYTGPLTARLPVAVRVLMFKADGSTKSTNPGHDGPG